MIDCAQIRLELLRHHVRQNHHQDNLPHAPQPQQPARTSTRPPVVFSECGPISAAFHNPTRVALFQLTNTQRPLQMSRFTVTPVATNQQNVPVHKQKSSSSNRQLHVRVHNNEDGKQAPKVETCSGSPSDSIDSGMPNSPAFLTTDDDEDTLSPLPSAQPPVTSPSAAKNRFHFGATAHASPNSQPQFRARSASECLDFRQPATIGASHQLVSTNNGSSNSLSPNGTPLRSILKKPKVLPPGMGNTCVLATNNLRRVPTRYVLARSVSECHDDSATVLSNENLELIDDEVVSMEDLSMVGNGGSPLSVCAEVDEETGTDSMDEPQKPTAEQQRKKRVSFNEQVQARIYRSNSSILATKNKLDRKVRNRMRRRTESESMDQPTSVEDLAHIPTIPLCKFSAEEKAEDESAPSCDGKDMTPISDRRDSGFDPNDSGMDSPPEHEPKIYEEEMQVESPKRVQRVISSDSAFGDEIEMME